MKKRALLFVVSLCVLLAACQNRVGTSAVTTTAAPDEIREDLCFQVSGSCDMTDPEGKNMHFVWPRDLSGTIEVESRGYIGFVPVCFEFLTPYQDFYTFQTDADWFIVDAKIPIADMHSKLTTEGAVRDIVWRQHGWTVRSAGPDGTDVTFYLNNDELLGEDYLTDLIFHTDGVADIVMTKENISVTGMAGAVTISLFDLKRMADSEVQLTPQGGSLTLDLRSLKDGTITITSDGETSERSLEWVPRY